PRGEAGEAHAREQLVRPAGRAAGADEKVLEAQRALSAGAEARHRGVEREENRHDVGGRGGVDDVAADGADVPHLVPPHDLGARGRPLSVRTRTPSPKSRAVTSCGHTAASSAAARFSRGAIRCSLCTGTRNVGPDTATDPTTPSPRMTGAATARPPATSSSSTIA